MNERHVSTRKGIPATVREAGSGAPLVYLHGAAGLQPEEPLLERLAERFHVLAPVWPGYGEEEGEELLEDMLDFALHGWDLIDALVDALAPGEPPILVGHSMGGMIAAEMACLNPKGISRLALLSPLGLWIDAHPIPDLFSLLPFQLSQVLFHDPEAGEKLLTRGLDFSDMEALQSFLVGNARKLGTAGKILFPIPNRRLSKRLYRQTADSLVVWGREDRFVPPAYAERWHELLPASRLAWVEGAGHMLPYEQPDAAGEALLKFLGS